MSWVADARDQGHSSPTTNTTARCDGETSPPPVSRRRAVGVCGARHIQRGAQVNEIARPTAGGPRLGFGGYPAWFDCKPLWMVAPDGVVRSSPRPRRGVRKEMVNPNVGQETTPRAGLDVGSPVDVRNRYLGSWSHGFEVAGQVAGAYLIRRLSDGSVLPDALGRDEVRSDRRKAGPGMVSV